MKKQLTKVAVLGASEREATIVRYALEQIGKVQCQVEPDVAKGLAMIQTFQPEMVILDFNGNAAACKELLPHLKGMVVVVLGAFTEAELGELRQLGVQGSIPKPIDLLTFASLVIGQYSLKLP